jgi:hypothetical protein
MPKNIGKEIVHISIRKIDHYKCSQPGYSVSLNEAVTSKYKTDRIVASILPKDPSELFEYWSLI